MKIFSILLISIFVLAAQVSIDLKVNGKNIDSNKYRFKVGDQIEVACLTKDSSHFSKASISTGYGLEESSGFKKSASSASFIVKSDSGGDSGAIHIGCTPSPDKKNIGESEVVIIDTEIPGPKAGDKAKIGSMKIEVTSSPSRIGNEINGLIRTLNSRNAK